jgi:23S rRNA pseudoU1915 N3-methylase RlmH
METVFTTATHLQDSLMTMFKNYCERFRTYCDNHMIAATFAQANDQRDAVRYLSE